MIYKLAADRITKEYRKGNLSPEALKKLKESGAIRPIERYVKGINKGTFKMLARLSKENQKHLGAKSLAEAKIYLRDGKQFSPNTTYSAHLSFRSLFAPKDYNDPELMKQLPVFTKNKTQNALSDAIAKRHELYELRESLRDRWKNAYNKEMELSRKIRDLYSKADSKLFKKYHFEKQMPFKEASNQAAKVSDRYRKMLKNKMNVNFYGANMLQPLPNDAIKGLKNKIPNAQEYLKNNIYNVVTDAKGNKYLERGRHVNLKILTDEGHLLSGIPHPEYTSLPKNVRIMTGERQYLKKILEQDPFIHGKPKNINKILKNPKNFDLVQLPKEEYSLIREYAHKLPITKTPFFSKLKIR